MQSDMTALEELYVWQVNEAVAADRMDLVAKLDEEYVEEALRLMSTTS